MPTVEITRRSFLAVLGGAIGGLTLAVRFGEVLAADAPAKGASANALPGVTAALEPNLFVHLAPDGRLVIVCARSEMGQGVRSSLPVLIADELGADMARVEVIQGDADKRYGDQNTDGSSSVRGAYKELRMAGATGRTMLIEAAARRWKVPAARLTTYDHAVHDPRTGRSLGFGELAGEAGRLEVPSEKSVQLRPDAELRHVGTLLPLIDGPAFVTGAARFGADVQIPGMLTALIARPPVVGGKVARVNDVEALKVPGVRKVVTLPEWKRPARYQPLGGVAVIADHTWAAMKGRDKLEIVWDDGDNASYESAAYKTALEASVRAPGKPAREVGNVDTALSQAATSISAEYYVPHLVHAPMEPPAALARVDAEGCEIWTSTQNPQGAQEEVAKALDIPKSQVKVHVTYLGGGFGRKSKPDHVVEAALLSREAGAPVRVQWSRSDEIQNAYYHAVSLQRLEAGLDGTGRVTAWRHRIASPSIHSTFMPILEVDRISDEELGQGVLDLALDVPNIRVERCEALAHVRIGWMRSVYNINHAFAVQSFIDELAVAAKKDPRTMLLEVLGPARHMSAKDAGVGKIPNYGEPLEKYPVDVGRLRHVIERVTERAGWDKPRQNGRALGLAAHRSFLTYVGVVAAVVKDARGRVQVEEVWITADAGSVVNLERVQSQLEGAVIFGMSAALYGAVTMRGGAVEQSNFRDYPLVRIGEAPRKIHVEVIASKEAPGGVGEPGVPPIAPAIANAVYALTGTRVRALPIRGAGL